MMLIARRLGGLALSSLFALPAACKDRAPARPLIDSPVTELSWPEHPHLLGVSGAVFLQDRLLLAPERGQGLIEVSVSPFSLRPLPLEGQPDDLDLEALAIARGRLFIGTEAQTDARTSDRVLTATRSNGAYALTGQISFRYEPFELQAKRNKGVEALCSAGGVLVAASEMVRVQDGRRFAAAGWWHLDALDEFHPFLVELGSKTGKLSGMSCIGHGETVEVQAIERHFGVMRMVRFTVPILESELLPTVPAKLVLDLVPYVGTATPNLESIVPWDGGWLLVSDNHYRTKTGPTRAFWVKLP